MPICLTLQKKTEPITLQAHLLKFWRMRFSFATLLDIMLSIEHIHSERVDFEVTNMREPQYSLLADIQYDIELARKGKFALYCKIPPGRHLF